MYKITNIETLGTAYTVSNPEGTIVGSIQIIAHTEILEAAFGEYNEVLCGLGKYIKSSVAAFAGNEGVDPHSIYWHATEDEDVVLSEIIEYAIINGYTTVILEHLEPTEH